MSEHHPRRRVVWLVAVGLAVELGLVVVGQVSPAMSALSRTGMFVAAGAFAVAIWHAMRNRTGNDRRQEDRRSGA